MHFVGFMIRIRRIAGFIKAVPLSCLVVKWTDLLLLFQKGLDSGSSHDV